jgi:cell division transport system permease protein
MPKAPTTKPNYFYSIVSVTLVLFLLGLFGLLVVEGRQAVKVLKEKIEIIVELKPETSPAGVDELKQLLAQTACCKPNSVRFISKEEGAALMQEEFGEEFLKLDMPNPLYDVITFNVKADYLEKDSLANIRQMLRQNESVSDVYYQESVTDAITNNLEKISYGLLGAGLFFVIVAVALILNTIRLALYANRLLIKNMELVGASWGFISRPYLIRSLKHGLLSALVATVGLSLLMYLVLKNSPDMREILNVPGLALLSGGLLLLGAFITVLSTYYVVKKYLKMRVDDLY